MRDINGPALIRGENVEEAWHNTVDAIRGTDTGSIENLLVHVHKPVRQVPKQLKAYESDIESWSAELQSVRPRRLPFTHGERIFQWSSGMKSKCRLDQLRDYVVPMLLRNPKTKRAIVMVRDPVSDTDLTDDPVPALISIQFKLDDRRLHATAYYRAQEMYFFWLVNIFELISMQERICDQLRSRSPESTAEPGSITTIAFAAYINPVDLGKLEATDSSTLAIERFGISRIKKEDLEKLLESALVEGDASAAKELRNILVHDKRTLDRIRDVNYQGLERWQNFLQINSSRVRLEYRGLPSILRKVLFDLISLDMQLERGEELAKLKEKIQSADSAMEELVNALAQKVG